MIQASVSQEDKSILLALKLNQLTDKLADKYYNYCSHRWYAAADSTKLRRCFFLVTSSASLETTRYFITRPLPALAVLIVIVIVIFIVSDDIIIITPVGAILKATEVNAFQAICHTGTWRKLTGPAALARQQNCFRGSRTAFGAGRPPFQSIASLPSSVHQPHPRGEGISGHRWRLRFRIAAW